jgi:very-short-patch-repair endonuclease
VRQVAALADGRAANPFESALRATCLDVRGLRVVPQVPIVEGRWLGRPDLVDQRLRIALEADSFAWHGERAALRRDANRYNALVAAGWLVLRFSWEDVMFEPLQVRAVLEEVVRRRTEVLCPGCGDAWVAAA